MMKILLVYAIPEEKIEVNIPNAEVIYVETGIGKVNAAMHTMRAICEYHPDVVINLGSAGTLNHKVGDIIVCNSFVDRDLRNVTLDGVISEIEFDRDAINRIFLSEHLMDHAKLIGTCNTGDSFITQGTDIEGDVIDMESYAVADVCRNMGIPFIAVKYVTDVVGQNSAQEWYAKLKDAREGLTKFFNDAVK
ncbi:MAG: 5'-methylthioadenosine/S-adenosylhomocysteine nucleosidase [Bacteroidales bacterium]|nr:5'-methylthioadenosine/S-adenosylhomocysteine nucleosidase [Bacteroidales bacterium]MBO7529144.1 5'-methylthioadenosine/S-adenosylhomocysteine nucleosidase [Bacteroidales bacterium]